MLRCSISVYCHALNIPTSIYKSALAFTRCCQRRASRSARDERLGILSLILKIKKNTSFWSGTSSCTIVWPYRFLGIYRSFQILLWASHSIFPLKFCFVLCVLLCTTIIPIKKNVMLKIAVSFSPPPKKKALGVGPFTQPEI